MKKRIFLIIICLIMTSKFQSQVAFGVNPGINLNGATFGYKFKNIVPYLGFQLLNMKGEMVDSGKENDPFTGNIVDYEETYSAKLTIMLPTLGVKYFFLTKNKIKAYANLNFSRAFLSGSMVDDSNPANNIEFQETIKNTKIYTGVIGIGTEYFFDDNFSIGGEFGFRTMRMKSSREDVITLFDPNTGNPVSATIKNEVSAKFNPTYTKLSLNYYF